MRKRDGGAACTVYEAAEILGLGEDEVRRQMAEGELDIGTVRQNEQRRTFRVDRRKLMQAAGITEWPETRAERRLTEAAAKAARMIRKDLDVAKTAKIVRILGDAGAITRAQRRAMERAVETERGD